MKERGRKVLTLAPLIWMIIFFNLRPASLVTFALVLLIRTAGLLTLGGAAVGMVNERKVWHCRSREAWT